MKYMLIMVLLFSTSLGCAANLQLVMKDVPEKKPHVHGVSSEEEKELQVLDFYRQANEEIYKIIAEHYYGKGWKEGWAGCAKQKPMHINTGPAPKRIKR